MGHPYFFGFIAVVKKPFKFKHFSRIRITGQLFMPLLSSFRLTRLTGFD
jgi:hypothetical protein